MYVEKELVVSTRPTPPSAKWRRGEEAQLKIVMPTDKEVSCISLSHTQQLHCMYACMYVCMYVCITVE